MWLTSISIRRPLLMLTIISGLLVMGVVSWTKLGVDLFPSLDAPIVTVTTIYPGAGPDAVDTLVTKKVEDAVAGLNDIDYIQSSSFEGVSSVVVVFTEKAGKETAVDVERRVNGIRGQLPEDIKDPTIGKYDPMAQPVMLLSLSGTRDLGQLQRLVEDKLQKRLEATSGVGQVSLIGGLQREIQIQVDQRKLQARGLSVLQVNQALAGDNLNVPAGTLTQGGKAFNIRLNNQAQTPDELGGILVSSTPTGPVYLRDVATIVDTYKDVSRVQRTNGHSALAISLVKQASANTIETADAIKKTVASVQRELPADVQVNTVYDGSTFVRQSVEDVQRELFQAILLTGLVLLVFLHTFRSTLIVLLAIPTSLIATLAVMFFMGFSFNMMSLMGLTLTVGILVDDSIVVLENIFRHLQSGEEPREAALNGRSEIGFAAITITLVDIVVFTPIAFMSGMVGQYFRQFGLVIATATLFSLFVSFTLTPMLASRWYRRGQSGEIDERARSRNPMVGFAHAWNRAYGALERSYRAVLVWALRLRWLVVFIGVASFAAGMLLVRFGWLGTEFMPDADVGQVLVNLEMPAGTSIEATDSAARKVEERVLAWPEVNQVSSSVGVGGSSTFGGSQARFARLQVTLKPKALRARTPFELADEARTFGRDIPGAVVRSSVPSMVNIGSTAINIRIQGDDPKILSQLAQEVAGIARRTPGAVDVNDGGVTGQPELVVQVDRQRAADLGLTPGQVASVLRTGLAGTTVSTFRPEGTTGWDVTVILDPNERSQIDQVSRIPIVTPRGAAIQLGQVAQISSRSGPSEVDRRDRQRSVFVTADVSGRPVGDVSGEIQAGVDKLQLPAGYSVGQGGAQEAQNESFVQIFQALGLSVLLMYMLMVALFNSLLYPLIVMLSIPLAAVGAFGLLALTRNTINMMSLIGLILLTGLVGKNAILLVDYTNTLRARGLPRDEALLAAGPTRLRPILMTTSAMVLAMLPLAMRLGEGGEWRAPMAVAVIGGLLSSTLLTLVLVPAVYTLMDDFQGLTSRLVARLRRRREAPDAVPPRAVGGTQPAETPATNGHVSVPVGGSLK